MICRPAIDPGEEAVHVLESSKRDCLRIPLRKDGTVGKPEVFAENFRRPFQSYPHCVCRAPL